MGKLTRLAAVAVAAGLTTACGGASQADYDSVRDAFNTTLSDFGGSGTQIVVDISNDEIDCVATALDVPVGDLDDELRRDADADADSTAEMFRCLNDDSIRSLFGGALGADGQTPEVDRECLLDKIVAAFNAWKADGGDAIDLEAALNRAAQPPVVCADA